ncbi:SGNH/GDSL hydrolase family protein [Microbacterium sp. NPDC019599]|uniref:SGNH/GDSL hydrolase family protein n=1 Tax=Microbacterium sp. NPDC019599 TaxID=3154690 RepID=UPI0033FFF99E
MNAYPRTRRVLAGFVAGVVVATTAVFGGSAANAAPAPPAVMAGLGDSMTQAIMTCSSLTTCASNSWSTGTSTTVVSHASRLRAAYPGQPLTVHTNAATSANSSGLLAQAQKAVTQNAGYVTIEIGANDACTRTVSAMTSTGTFETNIRTSLQTLTANGAQRQIFIASVPNLMLMYEVNKGSASARLTWALLGLCQSLLASPTSTRSADVARRAAVQQRVIDYNAILQRVCAEFATCRYDQGALYSFAFTKAHISTRDYFHPSVTGQAAIAAVTWPKTQWAS